jgi:hypothetical protein
MVMMPLCLFKLSMCMHAQVQLSCHNDKWLLRAFAQDYRRPDVWAQLLVDCHNHMRLPAGQQEKARFMAHKYNKQRLRVAR